MTFRWRDYRHGNVSKLMSLDPGEFIRRFLLHSLPDGFHRIRHYGFLANGCRRTRLARIGLLLAKAAPAPASAGSAISQPLRQFQHFDPAVCPCCGGTLRITATLPRCMPRPDTS